MAYFEKVKKALKPSPKNPGKSFRIGTRALFDQGKVNCQNQSFPIAQANFQLVLNNISSEAYQIDTSDVSESKLASETSILLGLTLAKQNKYHEAYDELFPNEKISLYDQYIKSYPSSLTALPFSSDMILYELGKTAETARAYDVAIRYLKDARSRLADPSVSGQQESRIRLFDVMCCLGRCYYMSGRYEKAVKVLTAAEQSMQEQFSSNNSSLAECRGYLGCAYHGLGQGHFGEAEYAWSQGVSHMSCTIPNLIANEPWSIDRWRAETWYKRENLPWARRSFLNVLQHSVDGLLKLREAGSSGSTSWPRQCELTLTLLNIIPRLVEICYACSDIKTAEVDIAKKLEPLLKDQHTCTSQSVRAVYHSAVIQWKTKCLMSYFEVKNNQKAKSECETAISWHQDQNCEENCDTGLVTKYSVILKEATSNQTKDAQQSNDMSSFHTISATSNQGLPIGRGPGRIVHTMPLQNVSCAGSQFSLHTQEITTDQATRKIKPARLTIDSSHTSGSKESDRPESTFSQDTHSSDNTIKAPAFSRRVKSDGDTSFERTQDISEQDAVYLSSTDSYHSFKDLMKSPYEYLETPTTPASQSSYFGGYSLQNLKTRQISEVDNSKLDQHHTTGSNVNKERRQTSQMGVPPQQHTYDAKLDRFAERLLKVALHIDKFETFFDLVQNHDFSDIDVPVTRHSVLPGVSDDVVGKFEKNQDFVLTEIIDLAQCKSSPKHFTVKDFQKSFKWEKTLGTGSGGEVIACKYLPHSRAYAIKRINRKLFTAESNKKRKNLINELRVLGLLLPHKHIVRFVASFTDRKFLGLIMSPVADIDLHEYLKKAGSKDFPFIRSLFGCLTDALKHMHNNKHKERMVHEDIKPKNILLKDGAVYISDFGISRIFASENSSKTKSTSLLTLRYTSPEVDNEDEKGSKTDVFSMGLVFLDMFVKLKGLKVDYVVEYLRGHGNCNPIPCRNIEGLNSLMDDLEQPEPKVDSIVLPTVDNAVLEWLRPMLEKIPGERPSAPEIRQTLLECQSEDGDHYCGQCCRYDE